MDSMVVEGAARGSECNPARVRADLYHFLELALAHPGEDGHRYFSDPGTEAELADAVNGLETGEAVAAGLAACCRFLEAARSVSFEELEAAHIGLFSANFPVVPCPPYGSLFTVEEAKRLEEMLAIKEFYRNVGMELSPAFDDLPDHVCVELEVMHLLSFREAEAASGEVRAGLRAQQRLFLDRFLQPFIERLAGIACRQQAANPYSHLLNATRLFLVHHRGELGEASQTSERLVS